MTYHPAELYWQETCRTVELLMSGQEKSVNYMCIVYQHAAQNKDCLDAGLHEWLKLVSCQLAADMMITTAVFQPGRKSILTMK